MESIKSTYTIISILTFLVTLNGCNVMEINQPMAKDITRVTDCKEHEEYEIVKNSPPPEQIAPAPGQKLETRLTAVQEPACPPVSSADIDRRMMNYQIERGTIYPMSESLRPTIVYKERPEYTVQARANKIQGVVVLNAVFADDRTLKAIKVVRGLPAGLTEKAIKAASRLGFEPAKKDGFPVSVRGDIEFRFSLTLILKGEL